MAGDISFAGTQRRRILAVIEEGVPAAIFIDGRRNPRVKRERGVFVLGRIRRFDTREFRVVNHSIIVDFNAEDVSSFERGRSGRFVKLVLKSTALITESFATLGPHHTEHF